MDPIPTPSNRLARATVVGPNQSTASWAVLCLASFALGCHSLPAADSESRQAILSGWPKYNPDIRRNHLEAETARRAAEEHQKAKAPLPQPAPPATAPPEKVAKEPVLKLPDMLVAGEKVTLPPRVHIPSAVRELEGERFETPEARRDRLVQKHVTVLEQVLNFSRLPRYRKGLQARAAAAEAMQSSAIQLNEIADLLALSDLAGLDTQEERKKLLDEYLKAYAQRPR